MPEDPRPELPTPSLRSRRPRPGAAAARGARILDEDLWIGRRDVLRALGLGGLAAAALPALTLPTLACGTAEEEEPRDWTPPWEPAGGRDLYPAERNGAFEAGRPLTPEDVAARKNNFYEFLPGRSGEVWRRVGDWTPRPWEVEIGGLVEEPRTVDVDELAKVAPLEERAYRFRCVERWSMTVPWIGVPMASVIEWAKPRPEAKYVRFISFHDPEKAPGQRRKEYPWPYYEALSLEEARHPLTLLATGIYGHGLPAQHGAPVRVIVPWKYGYKSPKSIARIEFTAEQPGTFWSDLQPSEYPFASNVEPDVPHPRWSQAREQDIATGDWRPTLPYNGYADEVAALYR
jgi:sulfoxide reductase catalytic subunit YedY